MNIKHTLLFLALGLPIAATAQGNCSDPILLSSILVSNTQCGASTGTIIITPAGGVGTYVFEWTPSVSNSNLATNLPADTYFVHIERANDPDCTLDTLVVINNSNGPSVSATISPAECLANNGSISLLPTDFLFNWSNGGSGPTLTGLASNNYYVTVTDLNNGCFSIFKYFVPKDHNSLTVTSLVQQPAKCGMSTGRAIVIVIGGSGQYSYNPGPGPQYNNLPAGDYGIQVVDNATGCVGSTDFSIPDLLVTGTVTVTPHHVRCHGQSTGFVEFALDANQNFAHPYTYSLKDGNGQSYSPGNLPAGAYDLQIFDADGCGLPPISFSITEPPVLSAQLQATHQSCTSGGQIELTISGGNSTPYIINWADLPGDDNPEDRTNLVAGIYSAMIFDSLFCSYPVDSILVSPNCNNLTTAHIVLGANTTDFFCLGQPPGLAAGATLFSILGGNLVGGSAFGAWVMNPDGCLAYSAGSISGFGVDTICIVSTAAQIGLNDTTCLIISITKDPPTKTSVFFTVLTNESSTACGSIPSGFSNLRILQVGEPTLNGTSDVFGTYTIDGVTACATFFAANSPGFNVDEIRVAVYDTLAEKCHIICYYPTVLPLIDCSASLNLADTLHFITTDCDGLAFGCVPIPYENIVNYNIIDNGTLYSTGYLGCATDTTFSYNVTTLPAGGGPYELTEWIVNGQSYTGVFLNFNGLVELMNLLDLPPFGWTAQGVGYIRGGKLGSTYGPLKIKSAQGNAAVYNPSTLLVPLGTEMRFLPGLHSVIFRNMLTACSDTVVIDAVCYDCLPIHSNPLDAFGNVTWDAATCASDTVFCTNIPNGELGQYIVTDNGQAFLNYTLCGNLVGMILDTGYHELHFQDSTTTCAWTVVFFLDCKNILTEQTIPVSVMVGNTTTVCLDTNFIESPIISIANNCEHEGSHILSYSLIGQNWCVLVTGQNPGVDTLCVQLCNANGGCADYNVIVSVTGSATDLTMAVKDVIFTLINEPLDFNIIANDMVHGMLGSLGGLADVEFLTNPLHGTFTYNPSTGIVTYTPNPGECGVDSFTYQITDAAGRQSAATIKITISCEKTLVFNGISPNGDGRNDTWHILGIERFPDNTVKVFNRWGLLVFEQDGYTNESAWNGQWNGKDLPDGTYFYLVEFGGSTGKLSGWVEILR